MKRTLSFLLSFCLLFTVLNTGCSNETIEEGSNTDAAATQIAGQDDDVIQLSLSKTPVDLSLPSGYLVFGESDNTGRGYVRPGHKLMLSARVYKTVSSAAGGWVEFSVGGEQVDRVPFVMTATDEYVTVKTYYILPFNDYLYLDEGKETPLHFEAHILTDDLTEDADQSDNMAALDTVVKGVDLEGNDTTADEVIVSLKTTSDLGENIAVPGDVLSVRITVQGGNGAESRVFVSIGDEMILNKHIYTTRSNSPNSLGAVSYYVPYSASGTLKINVRLENGRQASLEIPVASYDYIVREEGINWELPVNTSVGSNVQITCFVEKDSDIPFAQAMDCTRTIFVVNGVASEPVKAYSSTDTFPYMIKAHYQYTIPEDCTWPLDVKAYVDSGGLFVEKDESNNIAAAYIPISPEGVEELELSAAGLWYYPSVFEPGDDVHLFAAVYNGSSSTVISTRAKFFVDGIQLDPENDRYSAAIEGGQYRIFHEIWTVPDGLTANPDFTFEIAFPDGQTENDTTNNNASTELNIMRPDILVDEVYVAGLNGDRLYSNSVAQAFATVHNTGAIAVSSVDVEFFIDGTSVGIASVDLPPFGSRDVSASFTLPDTLDETPLSENITGHTGHMELAVGTGSALLTVTGDPQDTVTESNEENNSAAPLTLSIQTAPSQGSVYVYTKQVAGSSLSNVTVQITSNGKTASAQTDSNGECTFQGVPYGPYELSASKSGFNNAYSYDEILYEDYWSDYASLYMDDYSYISGRVATGSGSGLADVAVTIVGTNLKAKTNGNGEYSLKVPAGSYIVKYVRNGYSRQQEPVTLQIAQTVTKNITMFPALYAYVYGYVYDENEEPLPEMRVAVLNSSGGVLGSSTTTSEGYYEFDVGMTADEESVKLTTSGQGRYQEYDATLHRGAEECCNFSFVPDITDTTELGNGLSSAECRVAPWVQYHKSSEDIEAEVIYGMFEVETFVTVEDSVLTHLNLDITPDYWYTVDVKGKWSPLDVIAIGYVLELAVEVASFILPLDLTIEAKVYSSNKTKVYIKKIVILSDGQEVCDPLYPGTSGDYAFSPDVAVNWDDCLIKYYLKVEPNGTGLNPLPGYHYDRVLIVWNPKTKEISIGNYTCVGHDQDYNEIYIDQ